MDISFEPYRPYLDPKIFPKASQGCIAKSPQDLSYNCIAFAANKTGHFWWPHGQKTYWPEDIPRKETPNSFLKLFQSLGYTNCNNGSHEIGFEKIAIYATKDKKVTHAARQLPNGKWVSKLGIDIDIEHETVENLEGPHYGEVVRYLKRSFQS